MSYEMGVGSPNRPLSPTPSSIPPLPPPLSPTPSSIPSPNI